MKVYNGISPATVEEAVLFSFDSHSLPFSAGLRLHMVPGKGGTGKENPVVLKRGNPGAPDDLAVRFYGTAFPLPGYSGEACLPLKNGGLREPVRWKDKDALLNLADPFRLRVNFRGLRPEDIRLYALYAASA